MSEEEDDEGGWEAIETDGVSRREGSFKQCSLKP